MNNGELPNLMVVTKICKQLCFNMMSNVTFVRNYLDNIMVPHKDIHGFDVTMNDLGIVQGLKALTDLHEILPDDLLRKGLLQLITLLDEPAQVSIWGILHHNT